MAFLQDCASGWCRGLLEQPVCIHWFHSSSVAAGIDDYNVFGTSLAHIVNHIQNRIRDPQLNLKQIKWAGHIHFSFAFMKEDPVLLCDVSLINLRSSCCHLSIGWKITQRLNITMSNLNLFKRQEHINFSLTKTQIRGCFWCVYV